MTGITASMTGPNIGTLLSAEGITWGWFEGGFNPGVVNANGTTSCGRSTPQTVPFSTTSADYVPHHEPFQHYSSTSNPTHARPTGPSERPMRPITSTTRSTSPLPSRRGPSQRSFT